MTAQTNLLTPPDELVPCSVLTVAPVYLQCLYEPGTRPAAFHLLYEPGSLLVLGVLCELGYRIEFVVLLDTTECGKQQIMRKT